MAYVAEGAFSEIWQVRETRSERPCALKRLRGEWRDHPAGRQLLRNEAHVSQVVRSPHVIRVLQSDFASPNPYTLLEWIDGDTLEEKLSEGEPLDPGEAVWIVRQCAQALSDLAKAGFSHGDVKPANILIASHGDVKLIDLGFARPIQKSGKRRANRDNRKIGQGDNRTRGQSDCPTVRQSDCPLFSAGSPLSAVLTGTAEYMAPESLCRGDFNPVAADVYSLGVTLFQSLTGRLPFVGETARDVLRLQRAAKPPNLKRSCPDASEELTDLVDRMLAKQPLRRPHGLADLVRELIRLELDALPRRAP